MNVAAGLTPGQLRAFGLTIGALYAFHALRGILTDISFNGVNPAQGLVNFLVWVPGVVALIAFVANRVLTGQRWLMIAGSCYPIAVALWPLVAGDTGNQRVDFWIHQLPGLAVAALLMTVRLWLATACLFVYCLEVEAVMRGIGIITEWRVTLMRVLFSIFYNGFFFILLLALVRTLDNTNRVLDRTAWERAEAGMLQARSDEIDRLDRLTHDFVLSLLSSAAEGVPADKLQVQAETVRRQLESGFPGSDEDSTVAEVVARIARRGERLGIPAEVTGESGPELIPRGAAAEVEAAVDEAIRNALQHAHSGQRVRVEVGRRRLLVHVIDAGPGFRVDRLGARIGVRQSILQRMNSLPGGWASVASAPGRGTDVAIGWRMP